MSQEASRDRLDTGLHEPLNSILILRTKCLSQIIHANFVCDQRFYQIVVIEKSLLWWGCWNLVGALEYDLFRSWPLCVDLSLDFDPRGTCGLVWRDTGRKARQDAPAHGILAAVSPSQSGWSGASPWPLSGIVITNARHCRACSYWLNGGGCNGNLFLNFLHIKDFCSCKDWTWFVPQSPVLSLSVM